MVKTKISISLFLLAICFGSIGCNPGIIDVPPPTVTDVSQYFWKNSELLQYRNVDSAGNIISVFTLNETAKDSNVSFIDEVYNSTSDTLYYRATPDSVTITGLSSHSFIPLPDGYQIKPASSLETTTARLPLHHIIALTSTTVIASNNDSGIYYSSNYGRSWIKSASSSYTSSLNPITVFAAIGTNVYAGTYSGNLIESSDLGKSWKLITQFGNAILAMTADQIQKTLYISLNNNTTFKVTAQNKPAIVTSKLTSVKFISLAVLSIDTSIGKRTLLGGTDSGLFYRQLADSVDTDWIPVTSLQTSVIQSVLAANVSPGFYCSTSGFVSSSSDGISNWQMLSNAAPGMLSFDEANRRIISWTHQGRFQDVVNQTTLIPSLGTINDLSISGGNYYAATDSGVAVLMTNATKPQWFDTSVVITSHTTGGSMPGSVMLLHSISGSSTSDSTWFAGTLLNIQSKVSFPFTAKLTDHLNSVTMPDSSSYSDVIEVQYTIGTAGTNTSLPYLQIFYAKNVGSHHHPRVKWKCCDP